MAGATSQPPVLSTPDTHILSDTPDTQAPRHHESLSDEQIQIRYEIARTVREIKEHKWQRIALQFPDEMLPHSTRVYEILQKDLNSRSGGSKSSTPAAASIASDNVATMLSNVSIDDTQVSTKLTILADTSYGSCCVDEVAAEHVDADAIVHYGRACLSPTARLPVVHVYTKRDLDLEKAAEAFKNAFSDLNAKIILTADVPYADHIDPLCSKLQDVGYQSVFEASIVHDPSSAIPNRTVPPSVTDDPTSLRDWHLFHISEPPTSLLLTMTSRMASIVVFPTANSLTSTANSSTKSTAMLLRRRYALITSLATVPIWGILINTLSVRNYLSMIAYVQKLISDAGKKSYLFVVGKINAAKVANFSEIGGWVVIGCWESSLIDSKEFYRPIITPFELDLALRPDDDRLWTGEWRADFQGVLDASKRMDDLANTREADTDLTSDDGNASDESESEPPEFDLRTGRYVTKPRPMGRARINGMDSMDTSNHKVTNALVKRANGDIIEVNGVASPAAEYLSNQRTWRGLGSDFQIKYEDEDEEGATIEEGQTGIAGGYTVGDSEKV